MIVECPHGQVNCTTCRSSALVRELLSLREVARCARILSDALDRKILGDDRRVPGAWCESPCRHVSRGVALPSRPGSRSTSFRALVQHGYEPQRVVQVPEWPFYFDVELEPAERHREYLHNLATECAEQNIKVYGVMFPVRAYFSLTEHLKEMLVMGYRDVSPQNPAVFTFEGLCIFLDPMRDEGEPVPLFDDDNALTVLSMRRRATEQPGGLTKGHEQK